MLLNKYIVTDRSKVNLGHTYVQWLISLLGSSMFMAYGFQVGWVSPIKKILQSGESPTGSALSDYEMLVVASIASLTAVFATPIFVFIAESYGRKMTFLIIFFVHTLTWILKLSASHTAVLIAARMCSGVTMGGSFSVIPMYVREISQDSMRATLVSLSLSSQHVGGVAMYAMGSYLGYHKTLWVALSISIATLLLILLAPESPVFLVKKGKFDEATRTLATLRGLNKEDINIQNEINYMKNEDAYYKSVEKVTFVTIVQNKAWRRGYILCQTVLFCVALNGTFAIVTYAWSIMTQVGVTVSPELLSLLVPIVMTISSMASTICVKKTGRKFLLAGTFMISAVSLFCLASVLLAQRCGVSVPSWVHVVSIAVTVGAYSAGVMPVPNIIMNDIFKFQVRAKIIGFVQTIIWGIFTLQVMFFDLMSRAWGLHSVFYACAGVNLLGVILTLAFLPETKNRTSDQIEAILAGQKNECDANAKDIS